MPLTATDYAQHILLEMRSTTTSPLSTIPTRYVSHYGSRLPKSLGSRPPIQLNGSYIKLSEHVADALFADAVSAMSARGHRVDFSDALSTYNQQTGIKLDPSRKSDLYIDNWGVYPVKIAEQLPALTLKMSKRQWTEALGNLCPAAFRELFLTHLSPAPLHHVAQLSNRYCIALIPLTTFRTAKLQTCDLTHKAIHEADRAYRTLNNYGTTTLTL